MKAAKIVVPMFASLLAASAAPAKDACPARQGSDTPWDTHGIMPGDKWAWVYLTIDTIGRPTTCGIGENNMSPGLRGKVCRSFIRNWRAEPMLRDGKPVKATIKRKFLTYGKQHEKANREARKRYFLEHPEERSECYPK